jgi:hypothetical protein
LQNEILQTYNNCIDVKLLFLEALLNWPRIAKIIRDGDAFLDWVRILSPFFLLFGNGEEQAIVLKSFCLYLGFCNNVVTVGESMKSLLADRSGQIDEWAVHSRLIDSDTMAFCGN